MSGLKLSTYLRNKLLDASGASLADLLNPSVQGTLGNGSKLLIFKGTVPASPDDATSGATLICTIRNVTGTGSDYNLNFDTAANGVMEKLAADTWSGTVVNSGGVATFFRVVSHADEGTAADTTTYARLQGEIATSGQVGILSNTTLTNGLTQAIDYFSVSLPSGS